MVSARCLLLLVSVLLVVVLADSGADGCPSKLKGVFKKISKSFKLRKGGKAASKLSKSSGAGCKNPFFPCKGGGAASAVTDVVTDAAKLAKKAKKQKAMRRNLAIGAATAVGGLAAGGAVSGVIAAKKKAQFEKM